jgi:uncharacterized membrane protein (TIGR02234 family)
VTAQGTVPAAEAAARRRERMAAAGCGALGAAGMLLAVSRPWVHAVVQHPLAGRLAVEASGRESAPVVAAVALVALAGAVAVLTLRTVGRLVAGLVLVLGGAAAATAAVGVVRTPSDALRSVVSTATGRSGGTLPVAEQTAWPWVALAGAALVAVGGVLAVVRARRWGGLPGRYDAPLARNPVASDQVAAAQVASHAGAPNAGDPTTRPPHDEDDDGQPGADVPEPTISAAADPWDQLSRGEDPTD